ncbi:hypothetical protein NVP1293O_60 [Vibrio phage 1.293.O._10N.261.52.E1]|nr:hypothetical protein NVP1293O_60 [Vibrio phage 1.293.O._10N.261.52.E1]
MSKLLIGADPEFFVAENGKIIPAVGMVDGDKYNPLACLRGAMQVDGLALEFNINPASDAAEFNRNILTVMKLTLQKARTNTGKKLHVSKDCLHTFPDKVFRELPDEAKRLGCAASYTPDGISRIPPSHAASPVRVVGGHVHIGWTEDADTKVGSVHYIDCAKLARVMDLLVQARLVLHLQSTMSSDDFSAFCTLERQRKNRYGRWGEFRPKSYGMEYRSLSNFWIHSEELRTLVFEYTKEAFEWAENHPSEVDALYHDYERPEQLVLQGYHNSYTARAKLEISKRVGA